MSQITSFSQQDPGSSESPEEKIKIYKGWIEGMNNELKPPANIRKIPLKDIERYENELLTIIAGVDDMKNTITMNQFFFSTDEFLEKIHYYILAEISVALKKYDEGDDHEYFRCLFRCPKYLKEALDLFLI